MGGLLCLRWNWTAPQGGAEGQRKALLGARAAPRVPGAREPRACVATWKQLARVQLALELVDQLERVWARNAQRVC